MERKFKVYKGDRVRYRTYRREYPDGGTERTGIVTKNYAWYRDCSVQRDNSTHIDNMVYHTDIIEVLEPVDRSYKHFSKIVEPDIEVYDDLV